uniref:G-D-S-L family lipolytic protein n=1 Tax=Hirondellea gigas TaxID=1518452 RepID=A0A6A7G956_9CRUS
MSDQSARARSLQSNVPPDASADPINVKTVVVYGDSNTWAANPTDSQRYPYEVRWTSVLQSELGNSWRVIPEGLNGRTSQHDDPSSLYCRNGEKHLLPILHSHKPIDLLVIYLGVNDLKKSFESSPENVANGISKIIHKAQTAFVGLNEETLLKVLVICPPEVPSLKDDYKERFEGSIEKSRLLSPFFAKVVEGHKDCHFFDTKSVIEASPIDGIHLSQEAHEILGRTVAFRIKHIWNGV